MSGDWLILAEAALVIGGLAAFAWWQLRDVKKARAASQKARDNAED